MGHILVCSIVKTSVTYICPKIVQCLEYLFQLCYTMYLYWICHFHILWSHNFMCLLIFQVGTVFIWTYLFIVMDTSTDKSNKKEINSDSVICSAGTLERFPPNITESLLTSTDSVSIDDLSIQPDHELPYDNNGRKVTTSI